MDFLKRNHTRFFKLVSLALLGLFLCEGCKGPQEKFSAQEVSESKSIPAEVEEGFWQHLLEESIYLRWKRGLEMGVGDSHRGYDLFLVQLSRYSLLLVFAGHSSYFFHLQIFHSEGSR